ncbi:MAG: hypothetical protein AMXMBFR84_20580 [Candidatus Hydrogenedentota bacterium]
MIHQNRYSLRPARNGDCDGVKGVVFGVLRQFGLATDPDGIDADMDDLEGHYWNRGGCFYVLEDSDRSIVGTVGIYALDTHTCELRKMYLLESARGGGNGKWLLEHALEQARALGFKRVELETSTVFETAKALYRRYGFVPCDTVHFSPRGQEGFALDLK